MLSEKKIVLVCFQFAVCWYMMTRATVQGVPPLCSDSLTLGLIHKNALFVKKLLLAHLCEKPQHEGQFDTCGVLTAVLSSVVQCRCSKGKSDKFKSGFFTAGVR